mgnify:CR=1 FL=1
MKIVIQRSLKSEVSVNNKIVGKIEKGLVLLVGFHEEDTIEDIDYLVNKIVKLRIFEDENQKMNKSILDVSGEILSISQFTLQADTKKGNRPSFIKAMNYEKAKEMYELFNNKLKDKKINVYTGIYGADMKVSITNDGPVTIILESREWNVKR